MADLLTYARQNPSRKGIVTANRYLVDVASCIHGGMCPTTIGPIQENWKSALAESENKLTASFPEWGFRNIKQSENDKYILTATGVMSTAKIDSDSDILEPAGCSLETKMPFLWHHMIMQPVGKVINGLVGQSDVKIKVGIMDIGNGLGRDTASLIEMDALRISHGFEAVEAEPRKGGGWHIKKYRTFEASGVTLPANTDAVFLGFEKGTFKNDLMKSYIKDHYDARRKVWKGFAVKETKPTTKKGVVSFAKTGTSDSGTWDSGAAVRRLRNWAQGSADSLDLSQASHRNRYRRGFTFVANTGENMGDYKLPHHDIEDGRLVANHAGVSAAIAAVNGARGGVDMSTAERRKAFSHLVRHLKQNFNIEADKLPEFKKELPELSHRVWSLPGSWEDIGDRLNSEVVNYLGENGVTLDTEDWASINGTYDGYAIVRAIISGDEEYYRIAWSMDGDEPKFQGTPEEVDIHMEVTITGASESDEPADDMDEAKEKTVEDNSAEAYDRVLASLGI